MTPPRSSAASSAARSTSCAASAASSATLVHRGLHDGGEVVGDLRAPRPRRSAPPVCGTSATSRSPEVTSARACSSEADHRWSRAPRRTALRRPRAAADRFCAPPTSPTRAGDPSPEKTANPIALPTIATRISALLIRKALEATRLVNSRRATRATVRGVESAARALLAAAALPPTVVRLLTLAPHADTTSRNRSVSDGCRTVNSCTGPVRSAAASTAWSSAPGVVSSTVRSPSRRSSRTPVDAVGPPCRRGGSVHDQLRSDRPSAARRPCRSSASDPSRRCRRGRTAARPDRAGGSRTRPAPPASLCSRSTSLITSTAIGSRPGERLVEHEHRRVVDQRGGELDALLVAEAERLDAVVDPVRDPEPLGPARHRGCASARDMPCSWAKYASCAPTFIFG